MLGLTAPPQGSNRNRRRQATRYTSSMSDVRSVLCLSGHDPTGGAGVQADIEAVSAAGVHPLTVITALTVQDTGNVRELVPVAPALLHRALAVLMDDCPVHAVKIGLIGDAAQLPVIAAALRRLRVPVVCDPVLRAGGGRELAHAALRTALLEQLLPLVDVLTPNAAEARRLAPAATLADSGRQLLAAGARQALVTGGDEPGDTVENLWFAPGTAPESFRWPRLPQRFHGAGCTLAAAIAAQLALGRAPREAVVAAQAWTHGALAAARRIGGGRALPWRRP